MASREMFNASREMMFEAYVDAFMKYCPLEEDFINLRHIDLSEGYGLRNICCRTWPSNADNISLLLFGREPSLDHACQTEPSAREHFADFTTHDGWWKEKIHMKKFEGKLSISTLKEFKLYLESIEQHVYAEREKLLLAKIYKALRLTTAIRDLEESLPDVTLEMIFLLIHTTFQFKSEEKVYFPEKLRIVPPEARGEQAATIFKVFHKLIKNSYNQWLEFNMDPVFFKFKELPPLFIHVVHAFEELVRFWQTSILNEYCRTTAVILILMNILNTESLTNRFSEAKRQSVKKIIMILRESFEYLQGPSLLPYMDKKHLLEVRKQFVSKMQQKFQDAHDDLFDQKSKMITKIALSRGLKRCSIENNSEFKFFCPFKELFNCYKEYPKALEHYLVDNIHKFDIKFPYENIFFSDNNRLKHLPLMSEEAMKAFLKPPTTGPCKYRNEMQNHFTQVVNENSAERPIQEMDSSSSNPSSDNSETDEEIEVENLGNSEELSNDTTYSDNHTNSSDENSRISAEIPEEKSRTSSDEEELDKLSRRMEGCCFRNLNPNTYYTEPPERRILTSLDEVLCELLTTHGPGKERSCSKLNSSADSSATQEVIEMEVDAHETSKERSNDALFTDNHTNPFDGHSKNPAEIPGDESKSSSQEEERDNRLREDCRILNFKQNSYYEETTLSKIQRRRDEMVIAYLKSLEPNPEKGTNTVKFYTNNSSSEVIEIKNNENLYELLDDISFIDNHAEPSKEISKNSPEIPEDDTNSFTRNTSKKISSTVPAIQTDIDNNCQVYNTPRDTILNDTDIDSNLDESGSCSSDTDSFVMIPDVCDIDFS